MFRSRRLWFHPVLLTPWSKSPQPVDRLVAFVHPPIFPCAFGFFFPSTSRKEERRLGSMLFPAFKLQKILRAKVLSSSIDVVATALFLPQHFAKTLTRRTSLPYEKHPSVPLVRSSPVASPAPRRNACVCRVTHLRSAFISNRGLLSLSKVLGPWFWRRATKRRRKARLIGANLCREYTR